MKYDTKLLKNLRNKLFALITSIFFIVVSGAFVFIYLNTYHTIQQEIRERLGFSMLDPIYDPLFVRINLDIAGEIDSVDSMLDLPLEVLEQLTSVFYQPNIYFEGDVFSTDYDYMSVMIMDTGTMPLDHSDTIHVGGRSWRFIHESAEVHLNGTIAQSLAFLDVTDYENTLTRLRHTLLILGFTSFLVIAAISFYLSNQVVKPVAQTWEKQKQFIADASHELKTPVTIIKSNLGIAMLNPNETIGEQMEWLGYVKTGADRMAKLTQDLLALANADNPDLQLQTEKFNLSRTIIDVVNTLAVRADEKGIEISTTIETDLIIDSDQGKLLQIATILLDNAIKYAEVNGYVEVSLIRIKQQMILEVTNSGKGIQEEDLTNIFDRFYQTDPSRNSKSEGVGLGLSIAKALTEKLGGSLSVVSEEHENTTFTFKL